MTNSETEQNSSMDKILQSIRGVMKEGALSPSNEENDVLELTEVINEDGSIVSIKSSTETQEASISEATLTAAPKDVLSNIDDIINSSKTATNTETTAQVSDTVISDTSVNVKVESADTSNEMPIKEEILTNNIEAEITKKTKRLISEDVAASTTETFKTLVRTVNKSSNDSVSFRSGTTLEELTIEVIKPYLCDWLDQHLPSIVKTLVEKEIRKLIPKDEE